MLNPQVTPPYWIMVVKAMAAVSALNILEPTDTG
jgi:hypothetical protein